MSAEVQISNVAGTPVGRPWVVYATFSAVAVLYWCAYFGFGLALSDTGVFDHYDGLFHGDPPRVIRDLALAGADGNRSAVHPLFVLFLNPAGSTLASLLGSHTLSAVLLTSLAGAAGVFLLQLFLFRLGAPLGWSVLWSSIYASSASLLVFSAMPDTFVYGGTAILASMLLAAGRHGAGAHLFASLVSFGITSTNLAVSIVLYMASLRQRLGATVMRGAALTLAVLIVAVGAALVQKALYPNARAFYSPAEYGSGVSGYTAGFDNLRQVAGRAIRLSLHVGAYSLFAPAPYIEQEERYLDLGAPTAQAHTCHRVCAATRLADPRVRPVNSHPAQLTFMGPSHFMFSAAGWIGLLAWGAILAAGVWQIARRRIEGNPRLLAGLCVGIGCNVALHMIFGDDLFLYSAHWMPLLVGAAALATRPLWGAAWFKFAAAVVAVALIVNQAQFAHALWSVFSSQTL